MNRFMSFISQVFAQKDLTHYPELYRKSSRNLNYTIALSNSAVFYDTSEAHRSIDWKSF
jgi:hypothetical protein